MSVYWPIRGEPDLRPWMLALWQAGIPAENWKPKGWTPAAAGTKALVTTHDVHLNVATKTPPFWLLWAVLTLNVAAGIGIIGMASPLLQEVFAGRLSGVKVAFDQLNPQQLAAIAQVYSITMYILAGLLALGFICNLLIRPVADKYFMTPAQLAELATADAASRTVGNVAPSGDGTPSPAWMVTAAWLAVGVPIAWGVWVMLHQTAKLFGSG